MIEEYLTEFLYPRLESFGLDEQQQLTVIEDVRNRLLSLANKWNDGYFRKTILLTGLEEATFYEPGNTDLEIRAFVVCTIRNSLIEDIHSDETNNPKLKTINMPNPSDIIDVTEEAVNFSLKLTLMKCKIMILRINVFIKHCRLNILPLGKHLVY